MLTAAPGLGVQVEHESQHGSTAALADVHTLAQHPCPSYRCQPRPQLRKNDTCLTLKLCYQKQHGTGGFEAEAGCGPGIGTSSSSAGLAAFGRSRCLVTQCMRSPLVPDGASHELLASNMPLLE